MFRRDQRDDPGGEELYLEAKEAYRRSLELLPDDALWHLGNGDLLYNHFLYRQYWTGSGPYDYSELQEALRSLKRALELQPDLERAQEMLDWISSAVPEAVIRLEDGYDYLLLTATPAAPTPSPTQASRETPLPANTGVSQEAPTRHPTLPPTAVQTSTIQPEFTASVTPAAVSQANPTAPENAVPEEAAPAGRGPCAAGALPLLLPLGGGLVARRRWAIR